MHNFLVMEFYLIKIQNRKYLSKIKTQGTFEFFFKKIEFIKRF